MMNKLTNMLKLNIQLFAEGEEGGSVEPNQVTPQGTGEGASQPTEQVFKFGGIEVRPGDAEALAKANESYKNLQRSFQEAKQSQPKQETVKQTNQPTNSESPLKDPRLDYVFDRMRSQELRETQDKTFQSIKGKLGDDKFSKAEPVINDVLNQLDVEQRLQYLKNPDLLAKVALGELAYRESTKTPEQIEAEKQALKKEVMSEELGKYKQNTSAPPVNHDGVSTTIPPTEKNIALKEDGTRMKSDDVWAKARTLAKANNNHLPGQK